MNRILAAVSCSVLLVGPIARASDPAPVQQPVAVELTRMIMPEANWKLAIQGIGKQLDQFAEETAKENKTALPPDFASDLLKDLMTYQEVVDMSAGVYAKHYTDAELRDLIAFYRTPVGQKTIRLMPEILQDVNGQTMALLQQRMQRLMETLKARIASYAAQHPAAQKGPAQKAPAHE